MTKRECKGCGVDLTARRRDAIYCGTGCRSAARRASKALQGGWVPVRAHTRSRPLRAAQRGA